MRMSDSDFRHQRAALRRLRQMDFAREPMSRRDSVYLLLALLGVGIGTVAVLLNQTVRGWLGW